MPLLSLLPSHSNPLDGVPSQFDSDSSDRDVMVKVGNIKSEESGSTDESYTATLFPIDDTDPQKGANDKIGPDGLSFAPADEHSNTFKPPAVNATRDAPVIIEGASVDDNGHTRDAPIIIEGASVGDNGQIVDFSKLPGGLPASKDGEVNVNSSGNGPNFIHNALIAAGVLAFVAIIWIFYVRGRRAKVTN
jgi:hypothetical protein